MRTIRIGKDLIGQGQPVYIIAEAGTKHEGDIQAAERMIPKCLQE